jgi:ribosome-binding protein aMBF1 (putative translation factor)
MTKLNNTLAKPTDKQEQALRDVLSANIKKYRHRRALSQFNLAAKIDISTNFLADIEAGNTWVSSLTLVKLAKAFEIEAYELLIPEKPIDSGESKGEDARMKALMDRFSADLTVVLKDSVEKAVSHVKNEYSK